MANSIYSACSLCMDKPYSDTVTEDDLTRCAYWPNLVLAAANTARGNQVILSAMIPTSALMSYINTWTATEVVPGTFFYNHPTYSVGFSPTAGIHLNPYDDSAQNCSERLSWPIGQPGGRAGCAGELDMFSLHKQVFACPATWLCPEKSACTIDVSWDTILEEKGTFSIGGLGAEMIIGKEEVWVCDKANACSPNHMNALCFKYQERNRTFNSWGFQSDLGL
mmetsp:Transcript_29355/g.94233  ORF Transcript_29355/g.94233 Transcript_29355/m.94233 type:complete len:222 (+) Transcript_29355:402-1067(+)